MHTCLITVLRNGSWEVLESSELVPGDIVDLGSSGLFTLPCDAVVLEGDCIVNESMLTGESVPEFKCSLDQGTTVLGSIDMEAYTFSPSVSRHVIFAGTHLVRVRRTESVYGSYVDNTAEGSRNTHTTAMVIRTGFCSTKGALVRSILFPRPTKFRFYRDAFCFVGILALIAIAGFTVNAINLHRLGVSASTIAIKALDLITVVVPPALPASMSIGMAFAARRLRKKGIFCISPSRINVASKVAAMCFDKTGTLTEEGLDLLGIHTADHRTGQFTKVCTEVKELVCSANSAQDGGIFDSAGDPGISVIKAIASCHSLRLVDNKPVGDPLELKMLEFSGWNMDEDEDTGTTIVSPPTSMVKADIDSNSSSNERICNIYHSEKRVGSCKYPPAAIRILKTFDFASELRRASVIVCQHGTQRRAEAYVKGAPEVIKELCWPATVPREYFSILNEFTQKGYRVIAIAGKPLESWVLSAKSIPERAEIESCLTFMGFLVFENRLKPKTAEIIGELRQARIRMIMCTGDNPLTAVSVARECQLVRSDVSVFVSHVQEASAKSGDTIDVFEGKKPNGFTTFMNSSHLRPGIVWKESTGKEIILDPVALVPSAANQTDKDAVAFAEELAESGCYCLAVTGDAFELFTKDVLGMEDTWKLILMRGLVFARMSPEQKAVLVEQLQVLGYITGFCGDGANDCTALKTADVGISLSEAEASVAAPFTSSIPDISCVACVLREGRCSIATSFGCFKYMMLYSMIQFTSCCLLYVYNINLTNGQFLYVDLFITLPIAVCMNRVKPFKVLVPKRPSASLISKKVLTSLTGNVVLIIGFQVAVYFMTEAQSWYEKPVPKKPGDPDSTPLEGNLNTSIFLFSTFQYIFIGLVFSIGPPYRQPVRQNYVYIVTLTLLLAFNLWMVMVPAKGFYSLFGLVHVRASWRFVIFGMGAANFAMCYFGEQFLFPWIAPRVAKVFRFVRLASNRCLKRGCGHCINAYRRKGTEDGVGNSGAATSGIWKQTNKRENRKEYKLLLEKMVGGAGLY
ncbi:hypothetical protein IW138_000724 [Coemansia sp. RSA 986]|nr:hypothetical protein LPJ74_005286 [Coemansia sp. RSA 1843]KAJ2093010.1 hypothetical protein IW138_000724 [Coemansia sp. RSA 986]